MGYVELKQVNQRLDTLIGKLQDMREGNPGPVTVSLSYLQEHSNSISSYSKKRDHGLPEIIGHYGVFFFSIISELSFLF
jgi:hypothetical protein